MGFVTDAPLATLIPFEESRAVADEITRVAGEFMYEQVRELTPEYKGPASPAERGGREPGTARDSVRVGPVTPLPDAAWSITVWSDDPIMEFIEWDTNPHMIYPVKASALSWLAPDRSRSFAAAVAHPGTKGHHMFSFAEVAIESELPMLAAPVLDAWAVGYEMVLA